MNELEKLLLVFNEQETKDLEKIMEGNLMMEEYHEDAKEASQKEEIIGLYDKELYDEMMEYHRIKDAKEEGIEQGEKNKSLEIAKKLLEIGLSKEDIMKVTELNSKEIGDL